MSESNSHSKKTFVQLQAYVAQSVERPAFNRVVAGSIPAMGILPFAKYIVLTYLISRLIHSLDLPSFTVYISIENNDKR